MAGSLAGKVAVVTGGGRGVGRAVALALAREGVRVQVVARSAEQLAETVRLIEAEGGMADAVAADLTQPEAVFGVVKPRVEERWGPPQILVNAAGIFGPVALVAESDPRRWAATIAINTVAPYLVCRAFLPGMLASGWGRIVNVTSAASLHRPGPLNSAYATSKVALNHFTRCLASELAGSGVTAHVIHPGDLKTDMWRDIRDQVATLPGELGELYRGWARWIEETGGDPPEKAAALVLRIVGDDEYARANHGQFLWIEGGLQRPIPTGWQEHEFRTS